MNGFISALNTLHDYHDLSTPKDPNESSKSINQANHGQDKKGTKWQLTKNCWKFSAALKAE